MPTAEHFAAEAARQREHAERHADRAKDAARIAELAMSYTDGRAVTRTGSAGGPSASCLLVSWPFCFRPTGTRGVYAPRSASSGGTSRGT